MNKECAEVGFSSLDTSKSQFLSDTIENLDENAFH